MADNSFLQWPFLEDSHRTLAAELDRWAEDKLPDLVANEHDDLDGTCVGIVRALGEAGFTGYAVPASAGGETRASSAAKGQALIEAHARGLADLLVELSQTPYDDSFPYM